MPIKAGIIISVLKGLVIANGNPLQIFIVIRHMAPGGQGGVQLNEMLFVTIAKAVNSAIFALVGYNALLISMIKSGTRTPY